MRGLALAGVIVILVAACPAARAQSPATPESLEMRVAAYWKLRQQKDLGGMYMFYSAGYRARHPREEFLRKTRLVRFDILDFRVVRATVVDDRAEVTVVYRSAAPPPLARPVEAELTEPWVRDPDGRWYKEKEVLVLIVPGPDGKPQFVED